MWEVRCSLILIFSSTTKYGDNLENLSMAEDSSLKTLDEIKDAGREIDGAIV